jgi:glycosyltransferase involved in cell wall biosynthesis
MQGEFLEETIRSVLLQGYPELEYMVIDGGSTDNSLDIIRKYEPWLTAWVSEPDRGQADAINKGFQKATGTVMAWLNSDDCYAPGSLRYVASTFRSRPSIDVACGFRRNIVDGSVGNRPVRVYPHPDRYSLSRCCYVVQEATFWRRRVWETVGNLDPTYQFALDYEYWHRILAAGYRFHLLPRFIGLFRIHSASKGTRWSELRTAELGRIYRQYLGTTKGERELYAEISPAWWRQIAILHKFAHRGAMNHPGLARVILWACSLPDRDIPSMTPTSSWFWFSFE